jgi:branched-chain amino acid transport system ATP-binding protein
MSDALLGVNGLTAGYGAIEVLRGIDLEVATSEIVAVLGSNGAGKSTLNRTISGVLRATHGSIRFAGSAIEREKPATIVARGLIHVPEGRCVSAGPHAAGAESRAGICDLSAARRAAGTARRHALGRRAADAGDRPRLDGRA